MGPAAEVTDNQPREALRPGLAVVDTEHYCTSAAHESRLILCGPVPSRLSAIRACPSVAPSKAKQSKAAVVAPLCCGNWRCGPWMLHASETRSHWPQLRRRIPAPPRRAECKPPTRYSDLYHTHCQRRPLRNLSERIAYASILV